MITDDRAKKLKILSAPFSHAGRLTVKSTPGEGSVFSIHLPKDPADSTPDQHGNIE
jgi:hypothetical protein